jgi:hypothetical protein
MLDKVAISYPATSLFLVRSRCKRVVMMVERKGAAIFDLVYEKPP